MIIKALIKKQLEAMHNRMKLRPRIIWQEPGELDRSTYKGQKFEKLFEE